jgi:hypothetical protein
MKYATRHNFQSRLTLGVLVAMAAAGSGGGSGADLLGFEELRDLGIDDIMDLPLSQIADAQGFVLPPRGMYHLKLNIDFGEQGTGDKAVKCIAATWTILATIELANDQDIPLPEGTEFNQNWAGGGVQFFKTNFGPALGTLGANDQTTLSQALKLLDGKEFKGTVTHREDKEKTDDKGNKRKYAGVVDIALAA